MTQCRPPSIVHRPRSLRDTLHVTRDTSWRAGSLLIISLWLVAIVGALAVAIGRALSLEVRLTKYRLARAQAQALARSGVFLAMERLFQDGPEGKDDDDNPLSYDWLRDEWAFFPEDDGDEDPTTWTVTFPLEGMPQTRLAGRLRVQVIDEERKLNLNMANPASLLEPLKILLVGSDSAIAQAIIAARDVETPPDPAEDAPHRHPPYVAKDGPLAALDELNELPGMTAEAFQTLFAQASPYVRDGQQPSEEGTLNINTVTREVLEAFEVSPGGIEALMQFREGTDGSNPGVFTDNAEIETTLRDRVRIVVESDITTLKDNRFRVASETFLITSEGVVDRPKVRIRITAVVKRNQMVCGANRPSPCVIAWRET